MTTTVYIDSCAWNHFFDRQMDPSIELPATHFRLRITREVQIELQRLREKDPSAALVRFIDGAIKAGDVGMTSTFGFAALNADGTVADYQVVTGFDTGTWQSEDDRNWLSQPEVLGLLAKSPRKKEPLGRNQGDASLAVRSFGAVVVTAESRSKKGPMQLAWKQGGHVVFLADVEAAGVSLRDFIDKRMLFSTGHAP